MSQTILTQTTNREPQYLYTYAPTSFGWRQLLLEGTPLETYNDVYVHKTAAEEYLKEYTWYNIAGGWNGFLLVDRRLHAHARFQLQLLLDGQFNDLPADAEEGR